MWGDLDPLGIVFYPRYYEWIDGCSHLFFEAISINQWEIWRERKILFGLVETSCRYSIPGRYNQEIRIVTFIDDLDRKIFVLKHNIYRSADDALMVEGIEKRICMDVSEPENLRAVNLPEDIHAVLKKAKEGCGTPAS